MKTQDKRLYESWRCQTCGAYIGWVGRFFLWLFGTELHKHYED